MQRRVLVVSAAVATVVIALGVVAFATALDRILYSAAQDSARTKATELSATIAAGERPATLALRDVTSKGSLLEVLDSHHQVVAASESILSGSGSAITTLQPRPGEVQVAQEASISGEVGEPHAVVAQGVREPGGDAYVVVVAKPLDVEANTVRTATALLALGALALLGLLLVLISRILKQALLPVERIRSEVARITKVRGRGLITVPPTGDEIARLAQTMNLMLARLEQADDTARRFISDASHELRSPLATIRAAIEVSGPESTAADADRDAVIHGEVLRLQHLVEDLLTLAKADDGLPLTMEEVDLDDLLEGEVRRLRATGEVPVRASIVASRVVGDRLKLGQALRNLVDNAATHSRSEVFLGVEPQDDVVVMTVDNDGPPVPEDQREAVFDRFARLEESRERDRGGSGLGLAIVRTIIEAHGGTVRATTNPAGQCRFEARIPVVARPVSAASPQPQA
ncbi:HAMP domain-containing sensor histidine kinase [Pedococcus sp. KACC 23699]|uniref:histidine kinase n=1 Tax=Pedococcus sp. KACC 23699 TaxID=3149228 RepID=A0AAU7JX13_9MICO